MREHVGGRQLDRVPEDRPRRRHVQVPEVRGERGLIDRAIEGRPGHERLQLGPEGDEARLAVDVERLLAQAVPDERELAALGVPHRDREHPHEAADGLADAPLLERGQDDLGVGVAAETVSLRLQLPAQVAEVVDLAVEDHHEPAGGRGHRLMAVGREVQDREAAEAQRHSRPGVGPGSAVVRPAVRDGLDHAPRPVLELGRGRSRRDEDSGQAAHDQEARLGACHSTGRARGVPTRAAPTAPATVFAPAGVAWKKS